MYKYEVFSSPYFSISGLNTEIYRVNLRIQSEYRKIRTTKNSNVDMRTIRKHSTTSKYQTDTELSNEYWNITSANKTSNISWEILRTHKSCNQSPKRCLLCVNEKLAIALYKDDNMLNKRSDIISNCKHRNKYMLASYDSKD